MDKIKLILTASILCLFSSILNAALIDNGNWITDTETKLDWLKLTNTINESYDYVVDNMDQGEEYFGWQYAVSSDFNQLLDNVGGSMNCFSYYCGQSILNNGLFADLVNLIGDTKEQYEFSTQTDSYTGWTNGIIGDTQLNNSNYHRVAMISPGNAYFDYAHTFDATIANFVGLESGGSYLIRNHIAVPEPSILALLFTGLFGLGMVSRKGRES